jgi:vesicle coat complex subunit
MFLMHSDMNHSNMYAVGLALCTFANIASEEMSRDLVNEIEKLLGSSNTYIRKKVRVCILEPLANHHLRSQLGCSLRFTSHQKGPRSYRPFYYQGEEPSGRS